MTISQKKLKRYRNLSMTVAYIDSYSFLHLGQFLYTTCSPHVLQKEELLAKIYLYLAELIIRQERLTKLAVCRGEGTISPLLKILANQIALPHSGGRGTIAPFKILANQLALSHSGGRGDTTLLLSPPLDVQTFLRPWFVHSLAKQSNLTACT